MSDAPIQLIVAAFKTEDGAEETLKTLKEAKKEHLIRIKDAAIIRRDARDKIHIKDVRDVGGGKGSVAGALFGVGIALLTGGAGIVLSGAAGALVGGLTAKTVDMGLPNKRLKELGSALKPGTSAIVAILELRWVAEMEQALQEAGAQVVMEGLKADIAAQLEAGHEILYTAQGDESSLEVDRLAGDEETLELSSLVVDPDGVSARAAVITKDGVAAQAINLTEAGLTAAEVPSAEDSAAEDSTAAKA